MEKLEKYLSWIFLCFLINGVVGNCGGGGELVYYKMIYFKDQGIPGYTVFQTAVNVTVCGEACAGKIGCKSFGYHPNENRCYLYEDRIKVGYTSYFSDPGMVYYWKVEESCPSNYTEVLELKLCYKIYDTPLNMIGSEAACEADGGHLAIIDTEEKRSYMYDTYGTEILAHSFGGKWPSHNSTHHWFNGVEVSNWFPTQPDFAYNEFCLGTYYITISAEIFFNDADCSFTFPYVCEIPVRYI